MSLSSIGNYFFIAFSALAIFVLTYLPLEFQITEIWLLTPKISSIFASLFLFLLIIIFSLVDWNKLLRTRPSWLLLLILIVISSFVYREYRQQKLAREYLPKIYKVTPDWGIQAVLVKIEGVNFGPTFKKGKVFLDGEEMIIRSWDEKFIIAEQQVPAKFGQVELYVVPSDGLISNTSPFEIKDPNELKTF